MKKEIVLISACLLGEKCLYDGKDNLVAELKKLTKYFDLIPVCPEVSGGLKIPRKPSEIREDKVVSIDNKDVSEKFYDGAYWAYVIAKKYSIKLAILKESSPSCGTHTIYDGTFSNKKIQGMGITAKKLQDNGVKVISEKEALILLKELERQDGKEI